MSLDYDLWAISLRCKCYKDGEWFANVNCNERTILMQFLLRYDGNDVIQGLDPMTYIKLL